MNTTPLEFSRFMTALTASNVKFSHPLPECDPALCALTVSAVFNHNTPDSANLDKSLPKCADKYELHGNRGATLTQRS